MSAADALAAARTAGLDLRVDGQDLVLTAPAQPPQTLLDLLAQHKAGVIAILCAQDEDWPADEWRAFYDERSAIAEFDGGLSRQAAEALAHACCVTEWLNRHPVRSSPDRCLWCGQAEGSHGPLVPFGTDAAGQANKLSRTWATLLDALNKHRGKGQQKMTVEHVHVHAGGQAVVGTVERPGGGDQSKMEEQPHAKQIADAPESALRGADAERDPVPVARDGERPLPNARGQVSRRADRE